jgi:sorbitol/mannitol transport system substrate-binding protein
MVMYRTDLMEKAGLEMPDAPTWEFIREAAAAMTDRETTSTASACAARPAGVKAAPSSP